MIVVDVETLLYPIDLFRVANIHVFHPDGIAVDLLEVLDDFRQGRWANPHGFSGVKDLVEIGFGQAKVFKI